MTEKKRTRLTKEQKEELLRRHLAGEMAVPLSKEFGVTGEYVRLLKRQHLDPERFLAIEQNKLSKKLTPEETEKFTKILSTTTPMDHGFPPHPKWWDLEHGANLAEKSFGKKPSMRFLKELMEPYIPKRKDFKWEKPQPPGPPRLEDISPEFASDPDYVAYYMSPVYQKIRQREYELALADYEERFAEEDEREERMKSLPAGDFQSFSNHPQVGKRIGKHAKSKGSPFTRPKRRRKS